MAGSECSNIAKAVRSMGHSSAAGAVVNGAVGTGEVAGTTTITTATNLVAARNLSAAFQPENDCGQRNLRAAPYFLIIDKGACKSISWIAPILPRPLHAALVSSEPRTIFLSVSAFAAA